MSGVSVATLRQLQHGMTGRRAQNNTLAAISRALDWPDDQLIRVLTGRAGCQGAEPSMHDICDALRRIEAQLVAMGGRLKMIERAVAVDVGTSR
jgi:hypothetical protein